MQKEPFEMPLVQCLPVDAPLPSLQDNTADVDRLKLALLPALQKVGLEGREPIVPFGVLSRVASGFRAAGFRGSAVVNLFPGRVEVVDFVPGKKQHLPAMALDLGTTHLEATLLDLQTGKSLANGHTVNRQIHFGTDILSRIHFAVRSGRGRELDQHGLHELQQEVMRSVNELVGEMAEKAGVEPEDIRALSVSGNTTMVHLFLGVSPYHICREPYIPLVNAPDPCHALDLGIAISPLAPVWILPSVGSYFGGDLISGILASGLDESETTQMLIDVGTNAEVVLGNKDWLIACAGAAGPALEGGVAKMGMRAAPGAVEYVSIDTDSWELNYRTIENTPAAGICGSGLIDLVAELYLAQIVNFRGKFRGQVESRSEEHKAFLTKRLGRDETSAFFVVVPGEETVDGNPVVLSQLDLDAMMRSKAAMYAILTTLVSQVGVGFEQLDKIFIAGAFGKHIDPGHAVTLGMIPDLPLSRYESVGNSSLRGAELVLLSESCWKRSREIRRKVTYLELNVNQEFMIRFSGSRFIPHTDPELFPSVPSFRTGLDAQSA
jgi:uncharacterized 2Fe-2S/4Fe-4S cluster protein (DUF4445 family)